MKKKINRTSGTREHRRELLRQSLNINRSGGFSTHAAKMMARPLGGEATECTLTGHCRTFVFEFPRSELVAEEPIKPITIFANSDLRAAIVCDLLGYFEKKPDESFHFSIDVSLRTAVQNIYKKSRAQYERKNKELFLVIEEYVEFTPTVLSNEQCFTIDEVRNGEAMIEGGREGRNAILAVRALGCPWPEFQPEMYEVNVVLAAVKAVQNVTGHITQLCECSCFVNDNGEAVYVLDPTMSATGEVLSRVATEELEARAARMRTMLQRMMSESEPVAEELFDSIVLETTVDDGYLRLTYLRLWQAVEDAKKHLGHPGLLNEKQVIGGNRAPSELKAYRNAIAHWYTGRIDHRYLSDLEYTAMALLRRKYGGNSQPGERSGFPAMPQHDEDS